MPNRDFFYFAWCLRKLALIRLEIRFKMRDSVPLARDIPAFVMYCVNGNRLYDINLARIIMHSFEMAPQNLMKRQFYVRLYCMYVCIVHTTHSGH